LIATIFSEKSEGEEIKKLLRQREAFQFIVDDVGKPPVRRRDIAATIISQSLYRSHFARHSHLPVIEWADWHSANQLPEALSHDNPL
jgi:hypothetical protein